MAEERRPHTIREIVQQQADAGNVDSMLVLGNMYENGITGENSLEKAFDYYQKAARLGSEEGKERLAQLTRGTRVINMFAEIEMLRLESERKEKSGILMPEEDKFPEYELKILETVKFVDENGNPLRNFSEDDANKIIGIYGRLMKREKRKNR